MPIYEYRCVNGHDFEVLQRMSDEALTECQVCGAPAERVLSPVAVHFKGSGFYTTDYARKPAKAADSAGAGKDSGADTKTESKSEGKSEKADSKSSSNGSKPD